jgi:peptidoglycan/LPS O-acetylase OafA/YrhL
MSYVLAALSWNLLEKPFLALKRFFRSAPVAIPAVDEPPFPRVETAQP